MQAFGYTLGSHVTAGYGENFARHRANAALLHRLVALRGTNSFGASSFARKLTTRMALPCIPMVARQAGRVLIASSAWSRS